MLLSLTSSLSFSLPHRGPTKAYLHSAVLLWDSLMLVFGGSDMCFTDQLLVYNIGIHLSTITHFHTSTCSARGPSDLHVVAMIHHSSSHPLACDEWFETDYLGLPGDARRIGHTSFVDPAHNMLVFGGFLGQPYGDMLRLTTGDISLLLKTSHHSLIHSLTHSLTPHTGDCSVYSSEEECSVNVFCGWAPATNSCVSLGAAQSNPNPLCSIGQCTPSPSTHHSAHITQHTITQHTIT